MASGGRGAEATLRATQAQAELRLRHTLIGDSGKDSSGSTVRGCGLGVPF